MATTGQATFQVPDTLSGKTLSQLFANDPSGITGGDYSKAFGIGNNTPLTSGQYLTYSSPFVNDPGAGPWQNVTQAFGQQVNPAVAQAQQIRDFNIKSNQPAIQSLQGQVGDTQSAYQGIIDQILKGGQNAQDTNTVNLKREYAARGVPTDSLSAQQDLTQSNSRVAQPYLANAANTTGGMTSAINAIKSAIGQLESGNPEAAVQAGLSQQGITNQNNIAQAQLALSQQQQQFAQRYIPTAYGVYNVDTKQFVGQNTTNNSSVVPYQSNGQTYYYNTSTGQLMTTPNG